MPNPRDFLPPPPWEGPPIPGARFQKEATVIHDSWTGYMTQFSNKGPLIILYDSKGNEMCRLLVDVATHKVRVLLDEKYKLEVR